MRTIELFAGAGGAALGLEAAGCEALARVEWNKHAAKTLRQNLGEPVYHGDVRDWVRIHAQSHAGQVGLLWASPPCQAFSQAGARKGARDDRNGFPWTLDAIDAVKPTWVAIENVKGMTTHRKAAKCDRKGSKPMDCPGCYLHAVVLPELRKRFAHVDWRVLNAADYGVPQVRHRLIIVAGPRPIRWPEATHAGRHVSIGEALGLTLVDDEQRPGNRQRRGDEPSRTIGTKGNTMVRVFGGGRNPQQAGVARTYRDLTDGPSTTIAARPAGNAGPYVVHMDKPSACVSATEVKGTNAKREKGWTAKGGPIRASDSLWMATAGKRRRLTVEECAILQDFPKGYAFTGPKYAQYAQVGNAVPPTLARVIAEAIKEAQ